jgi:outer membrane protein OmpA-like peptidoglycan-associated protein
MMRIAIAGVLTAGFLAGCASSGPEMIECLQPDRRVVLEVNGTRVKPAPKPKEGEKPGKPEQIAAELAVNIQGNTAFDPNGAVLKEGGKADIEEFIKDELKGKQPVAIGSIIITGHSDKLESRGDDTVLSEARAKSVMEYLISKGFDQKLMFWEGRGSRQPVPVTKFCS